MQSSQIINLKILWKLGSRWLQNFSYTWKKKIKESKYFDLSSLFSTFFSTHHHISHYVISISRQIKENYWLNLILFFKAFSNFLEFYKFYMISSYEICKKTLENLFKKTFYIIIKITSKVSFFLWHSLNIFGTFLSMSFHHWKK